MLKIKLFILKILFNLIFYIILNQFNHFVIFNKYYNQLEPNYFGKSNKKNPQQRQEKLFTMSLANIIIIGNITIINKD